MRPFLPRKSAKKNILNRFLNSTLRKIRCCLNTKAQVVNKAQRQLKPESYFLSFFNPLALNEFIYTRGFLILLVFFIMFNVQVLEDFSVRGSVLEKPVHVINMNVVDNPEVNKKKIVFLCLKWFDLYVIIYFRMQQLVHSSYAT